MKNKLAFKKGGPEVFATTAKKEDRAIPKIGLNCTSRAANQVVTERLRPPTSDKKQSADDKSELSEETLENERKIALLTSMGNLQFSRKHYEEALKHYEEALHLVLPPQDFHESIVSLANKRKGNNPEQSDSPYTFERTAVQIERSRKESAAARLMMNIGSVNIKTDQLDEALRYFEMSLELAEVVEEKLLKGISRGHHDDMVMQTHIIRADVLQNIGLVYTKRDELAIAKEKYFESLQSRRMILSLANQKYNNKKKTSEEVFNARSELVEALIYFAKVNEKRGEYGSSIEAFSESIVLKQSIGSEVSQSGLPEVWSTLGHVYCKQDDDHSFMKALRCFQQVHKFNMEKFGPSHLSTVEPLVNISKAYLLLDDKENSMNYATDAIELTKHECDDRDSHKLLNATAMENLADVQRNIGQIGDALQIYRQCLYTRISVVGEAHELVVKSLKKIGDVLCEMDEHTQAIDMYKDCLRRLQNLLGQTHIIIAKFIYWIGSVYRDQRDYNRSLRYYVKAIDMVQKNTGKKKSPLIGDIVRDTGSVLANQGRWNEAIDHFNLALKIYRESGLVATHPEVLKTARAMTAYGNGTHNNEAERSYNYTDYQEP